MQTENSFFGELKNQYRFGGMTLKLLFINAAIFLVIAALEVVDRLMGGAGFLTYIVGQVFVLQTGFMDFITHPWGIVPSIFAHFDFLHLFWNMLFFFGIGRIFEQFFDQKRLLYTYLLGGIFGGLFEILSQLLFPGVISSSLVVGASGAVMAVLTATAFHNHRFEVSIFGLFRIRLIYIALAFILLDLYKLGVGDGTAHFAHIGGAALGMLSVQKVYSSSNIIVAAQRIGDRIEHFFRVLFNPTKTPKLKVKKRPVSRTQTFKTDEQYNMEAKERQRKTDIILDKISKSGYESLTKEEKAFLFQQSNNGR